VYFNSDVVVSYQIWVCLALLEHEFHQLPQLWAHIAALQPVKIGEEVDNLGYDCGVVGL
jgi:hypothetical protein